MDLNAHLEFLKELIFSAAILAFAHYINFIPLTSFLGVPSPNYIFPPLSVFIGYLIWLVFIPHAGRPEDPTEYIIIARSLILNTALVAWAIILLPFLLTALFTDVSDLSLSQRLTSLDGDLINGCQLRLKMPGFALTVPVPAAPQDKYLTALVPDFKGGLLTSSELKVELECLEIQDASGSRYVAMRCLSTTEFTITKAASCPTSQAQTSPWMAFNSPRKDFRLSYFFPPI
ncbi:hypothetical protein CcaCcLH18_09620 [Colletotrichum camelliae]|nr:hypothetical protein CcaCcLH18_09620 [Colletotrichum camelliae]